MFRLFQVSVLIGSVITGCLGLCDETKIRECQVQSGMMEFFRSVGIDITADHAMDQLMQFKLNEGQLRQYCRMYDSYESCMETRVLYGCPAALRLLMSGIHHGIQYICKDTFEEYIDNYQMCLKDDDVIDQMMGCIPTPKHQNQMEDDVCNEIKKGQDCQSAAVARHCNLATVKWFKILVAKMDKPIFEYMDCSTDNSMESTPSHRDFHDYDYYIPSPRHSNRHVPWLIVACVSLGLTVLGGICVGISHTMRRSTNRQRRAQVFDASNQDMTAPAYTDGHAVVVSDEKKLIPV